MIEADDGNTGRLGLLGSAIDGTCEVVVAADDRMVEDAFDGLRPGRGRNALGGGNGCCEDGVPARARDDGAAELSGGAVAV